MVILKTCENLLENTKVPDKDIPLTGESWEVKADPELTNVLNGIVLSYNFSK